LLLLPSYTPSYMIYIDAELEKIFFYTFHLHLRYCIRALRMDEWRLPKITAVAVINSGVAWFKHWGALKNKWGMEGEFDVYEAGTLQNQLLRLVSEGREFFRQEELGKAVNSERYVLYRELKRDNPGWGLLRDRGLGSMSRSSLGLLVRLRGELLPIGVKPWRSDVPLPEHCPLCWKLDSDNHFHFLIECPQLQDLRIKHLESLLPLSVEKVVAALNDVGAMSKFVAFARAALIKRSN